MGMSLFRHFPRKLLVHSFKADFKTANSSKTFYECVRRLNYSAITYDDQRDPRPLFFSKEVQSLLRTLTRVDLKKVFRKRRMGNEKVEDPEYKFMTSEELEEAVREAWARADELLQIPPVVPTRKPVTRIISEDPALQGLETSKMVFADITFGIKDSKRLITVRDTDGTLREADWDTKDRINQIYFPQPGRSIKPPLVFEDRYFKSLLERKEYEFLLDVACIQFEPNDPQYQRITSVVYQHVYDNDGFKLLRSTRHFGALAFFLVWNKTIDNLLLELIETAHVDEANALLDLYSKSHSVKFEGDGHLKAIEEYIEKYSNKRGVLELGLQAYKDLAKQREALEKGLKEAHGLS